MSEYTELLKHPKWQKKRLEILKRDNFQCQLCNDENTCLNIHHKKYISGNKPWEYDNKNLITLCEDCHSIVEQLPSKCLEILKIVKLKYQTHNIITIIFLIIYLNRRKDKFCIITKDQNNIQYSLLPIPFHHIQRLIYKYQLCLNDSPTQTNIRSPL